MPKKKTRITDTREDTFENLLAGDIRGPYISFQEFSNEVSEIRDDLPTDEEGASLFVLNEVSDSELEMTPRSEQRQVETTTDDLFSARRFNQERSEVAKVRDSATNAEVTGDFERWSENPSRLDFPGVDTTESIGPDFE